ncbi:Gfo/Idh/MocA family protein [Microlunatus sp. Y2014]|uniref:Gfo/Idh/MocA family protein n=1 Tax=Microlunatus sp. Y2014 TaxID=3418488 RepID=UPI003DA71E1E
MIDLAIAGVQHGHFMYFLDSVAGRDDARIVGFSETDPAKRETVAAETGLTPYESHQALLEATKPTVVGVAAAFGDRGQIVLDALAAGAHVVADKPLCTTMEQLDAIEQAVTGTDQQLSVMFEKRGYGPSVKVRELVDEGRLGQLTLLHATGPHKLNRPTRPDWFWQPESYGGILNDLVVHDIDMYLWLTGTQSGTVSGRAGNFAQLDKPGFEDAGLATVHGDGVDGAPRAMASLEVHWMSPAAAPWHGDYRIRITGTEGTAELNWRTGELFLATHTTEPELIECAPNIPAATYFLDAISQGVEPSVSTADSILATRVSLLAQQSAANGGELLTWHR